MRDTSNLEPAAVLALFTWDWAGGDEHNREMDVEISRWGDPASKVDEAPQRALPSTTPTTSP